MPVKFGNHEKSNCHKEALLKIVTVPASTSNVAEIISTKHKKRQARKATVLSEDCIEYSFSSKTGSGFARRRRRK